MSVKRNIFNQLHSALANVRAAIDTTIEAAEALGVEAAEDRAAYVADLSEIDAALRDAITRRGWLPPAFETKA